MVKELHYRLDVNTLHRDESPAELGLNEIGRVTPAADAARLLRRVPPQPATGGFILIDEPTNDTVGAGMITDTR